MPHFCRNSLLGLMFVLIPVPGNAFWDRLVHGEVVVTMRNGNPCFSYPQDDEVRREPYAFSLLGVSTVTANDTWQLQAASYFREGLVEPNTPETCVEYGVPKPGMKETEPVKPILQLNVPYRVGIKISDAPVKEGRRVSYDRTYESYFCVTRNEKGEPIVVKAIWEKKKGMYCLKPGESERGFWQKLFGN